MKLLEISAKINAHLKRLEVDPVLNVRSNGKNGPRFYCAGSCVSGRYVAVMYISYQGSSKLSKADAEVYLAALDAGSNERHFEVMRSKAAADVAALNSPEPQ